MPIIPIVDAVRTRVPIPVGVARDDNARKPARYAPDMLYVWARNEDRRPAGTGEIDEGDFRLRIACTLTSSEHPEGGDRAVSVALDDWVDDVGEWALANRANALWDSLQVTSIDFESIQGFAYRGHFIDLAGNRLLS